MTIEDRKFDESVSSSNNESIPGWARPLPVAEFEDSFSRIAGLGGEPRSRFLMADPGTWTHADRLKGRDPPAKRPNSITLRMRHQGLDA